MLCKPPPAFPPTRARTVPYSWPSLAAVRASRPTSCRRSWNTGPTSDGTNIAFPRQPPALQATLGEAAASVDFAEIAITSGVRIEAGEGPADAFRLPDVSGVAVVFDKAQGAKCARSWKITGDVGSDPDYPDVSTRDANALRELKALGRLESVS